MIEVGRLTWRNFLSYGDYDTTLDLTSLGPCMVLGENGTGKSTIGNVLAWVFFGKTMHDAMPGDNVINWAVRRNCIAQARLLNGDVLTRTRGTNHKDELLLESGGEQLSLSTTPNQQQELNRRYHLDWELFCGAVFFAQYNRSWLELGDQQRKQILERLLRIDRLSLRATVAKEKLDKIDGELERNSATLARVDRDAAVAASEIEEAQRQADDYGRVMEERRRQALAQADHYAKQRDALELPDLEKLQRLWTVIARANDTIAEKGAARLTAAGRHGTLLGQRKSVEGVIAEWRAKAGKLCTQCGQDVPHEHVGGKVEGLAERLAALDDEITKAAADLAAIDRSLTDLRAFVRSNQPAMSLAEARAVHQQHANLQRQHEQQLLLAAREAGDNPHAAVVQRLQARAATLAAEAAELRKRHQTLEALRGHSAYLHRAYSDRRKIKSYLVSQRVPFFNARLAYYLERFQVRRRIAISDALAIDSDAWGYKYMSGGERKRVDLAFMFATHALYESLYGRQCNVMFLDEVDGRLDETGISALTTIINEELAAKFSAVLIVSHREAMRDAFPRQLIARRLPAPGGEGFTVIEEIR